MSATGDDRTRHGTTGKPRFPLGHNWFLTF